jgi:hypothetical protein
MDTLVTCVILGLIKIKRQMHRHTCKIMMNMLT